MTSQSISPSVPTEPLRFLPQRCTPCLTRLNRDRPWTRTLAVRWGQDLAGVRVTAESEALVEGLLRDVRRPELDADAPPNFSVDIKDYGCAQFRPFHFIYRDHVMMARRADVDTLLGDLSDLLDATQHSRSANQLALQASVVVREEGDVVVLPAEWHSELVDHQRRLAQAGLELRSPDVHLLDASPGLVVPHAPGMSGPSRRIRCWAVPSLEQEVHRLRPSQGVQTVFRNLLNVHRVGPKQALTSMARLAGHVEFVGLPMRSQFDILGTVLGLAEP